MLALETHSFTNTNNSKVPTLIQKSETNSLAKNIVTLEKTVLNTTMNCKIACPWSFPLKYHKVTNNIISQTIVLQHVTIIVTKAAKDK